MPMIDDLAKQGKVRSDTRTDIARTAVGVAIRAGAAKPDVSSVEALKQALLKAKSMSYSPESASGKYFASLFERLALGAEAKSRLAPVLSPAARRRLVVQMLADVLAALAATSAVTRTLVVTPDAEVTAIARAKGAEIIHEDTPTSLNGALRTALHASGCHADARCLILPADVPLVTDAEIAALLQVDPADHPAFPAHRLVIAPSHDGGGTNALVLTDHDGMGPSFGPDSFKRHMAMAEALHLHPRVVRLPGLGFDIDIPEDVSRLSQVERYRWLDGEWLEMPKTLAGHTV